MLNRQGMQLGNYHLVRLLGRGGFAHVYLGEHIHLKTQAAVKVLDAKIIDHEEAAKFLDEARTIANLLHPNIVRVFDFDVKDNTPFLVMDYAPNGSLEKHHPKGIPVPATTVVSYVKQVAAALQYAHDQTRLIHCDIKPANMLLGRSHEVLLSDFGIALIAPTSRAVSMEQIVGTLAYMAPEHLDGKPVLASDQYALGVVVYEWLAGELPFRGSHTELYSQHHFTPPPSLQGKVPAGVERVILRALAKRPQERFARVQDFAHALEDAVKQSSRFAGTTVFASPGSSGVHQPFTVPFHPAMAQQTPPITPDPGALGSSLGPVSPSAPTERAAPPRTTPLPEEPPIPVHPSLLHQRELIRRFQEVKGWYEQRREEVLRQIQEEEEQATRKRESVLAQLDNDVEKIRELAQEAQSELIDNGWRSWLKIELFMPVSPAIAARKDPSEQIEACGSTVKAARRTIRSFLANYKRPSVFFNRCTVISAVIAIVSFICFGLALGFSKGITSAFVLALLVFIGVELGLFSYLFIPVRNAHRTLQKVAPVLENAYRLQRSTVENSHQNQWFELKNRHEQALKQLEQMLHQQLAEPRARFTRFMQEVSFSGAAWSDQLWQQWTPLKRIPPVARVGTLTVNTAFGLPPVPALISCPGGCNLLIETNGMAMNAAISAVQALILRLLVTQPPGTVRFTFVDPTGFGRNVGMFLQLAEHDEILGTGGASVSPQQIEQQLQVLTGDIIRITQARLRNQYSPHRQQREADGEDTEPRRVLVVMGFPANFSTGAINDLLTITEHGPRYGISTIIVGDMTGLQSWSDDTLRRLEKAATMLTWDGQYFTWQDPDYQDCQLDLDALPPQDVFGRLLQEVARQALVSVSIEQNPLFKEALANPGWKAPRERVASWLGHPLAIKAPTAISFRRESGSNLLIVGKQEEVALGMLITTMVCLAAQNPPTLAQFSVLDLSIADLNALYGANTGPFEFFRQVLPRYTRQVMHRRDFRAHPSRFITGLSDELQERAGADDLEASSLYLVICGLPRVENVLQKDMLQGGEHISSSSVARLLLDVLRRGPELGMHTLVACDKLSGLEGILGSQALEHFDHRVVLRTISKDESNDLIEAPDAFALDEEHAIFFDKGRLEKFRPYRLPSKAWLEEAAAQIRQKSEI